MHNIDEFVFLDSDINVLKSMDFTPKEMLKLLEESIKSFDWLKVAKCITWIQSHPNSIYIEPLCLILTKFIKQFHPEEVIDALSEILEDTKSDKQMILVSKTLEQIACSAYKGDPSYHINLKCLDILHWLVGLNRPVSKVSLDGLIKVSKCNLYKIAKEANECLEDLNNTL